MTHSVFSVLGINCEFNIALVDFGNGNVKVEEEGLLYRVIQSINPARNPRNGCPSRDIEVFIINKQASKQQ